MGFYEKAEWLTLQRTFVSRMNDRAVGGLTGLLTLFVGSVYLPNSASTNQKARGLNVVVSSLLLVAGF